MIKSHMVRPEIKDIEQKKAWNCKGKDFCAENYTRKSIYKWGCFTDKSQILKFKLPKKKYYTIFVLPFFCNLEI